MSALCQKQTHAAQQIQVYSITSFARARCDSGDREPERLRGGKDTPATLAAKEQLFRSCLGLRQIRPELAWWRVWRD